MSLQINTNAFPAYAIRRLDASEIQPSGAIPRVQPDRAIHSIAQAGAAVTIGAWGTLPTAGLLSMSGTANDNISLLQTANSAIGTVKSDLLQLRALATQASSPSITQSRLEMLQANASVLVAEIDRIATRTHYLGNPVFDQNRANRVGDPSLLKVLSGLKGSWLENAEKMIQIYYGLKADGAPLNIDLTSFSDGPFGVAARVTATAQSAYAGKGSNLRLQLDRADFVPATLPNGGSAPVYSDRIVAHELTHAVMARTTNYANLARNATWFLEGVAEFIQGGDERLANDLVQVGGNAQKVVNSLNDSTLTASIDYSASYAAVRYLHAQIKSAGGEGVKDVMDFLHTHQDATLNDAFRYAVAPLGGHVRTYTSADAFLYDFRTSGAAFITSSMNLANYDTGAVGGFDADGGPVRTAESVVPDTGTRTGDDVLAGFSERFEAIGAPQSRYASIFQGETYLGQSRKAVAGAVNASALGINALNLIEAPADAIGQTDRAIRYVSSEQARIASQLGGYNTMFANLQGMFGGFGTNIDWFGALMSGTGFATLVGNGIRSHSDTALRAQANIPQQMVLHLLRDA